MNPLSFARQGTVPILLLNSHGGQQGLGHGPEARKGEPKLS